MSLKRCRSMSMIFGALFFTTGFSDLFLKDDVLEETESFIDQVKSSTKPSSEIDGLEVKELSPYVPHRLTVTEQDPFLVKSFVKELGQAELVDDPDICQDDNCGDGPPVPHTPFFLENYSLDQLALTGTLNNSRKGKVALIQTPDAGIVYAGIGEYIGQNNGLILSINREEMIVREKYRSPQGWQDRMATLPLTRN